MKNMEDLNQLILVRLKEHNIFKIESYADTIFFH